MLSHLWGCEVGRPRTFMRRFRAWRIRWMSMALSVRPSMSKSGCDEARTQGKRCLCKRVDVGGLATVASVIVALRPCSCRRRSRGILSAWLRLQSIAEGIVCGSRVVVVRLERAQLGNRRRQRLDVQGWRSWRAARPHVSLWTLEVAIMSWLREHCPRWWKRVTAATRRRWFWAFGGSLGLGAAIPAGTRRACGYMGCIGDCV
jgi:hypothetical protein